MATTNIDLSELDSSQGFVLKGIDEGERSGISVSNAGDINGDGIDDIVIGAPGDNSISLYDYGGRIYQVFQGSRGKSYVIFGSESDFNGSIDLETLDGSNGFVIAGLDEFDTFGSSVSNAGDVNGDGIDDLIVGTPTPPGGFPAIYSSSYIYNTYRGESYVIFGGSDVGNSGNLELEQLDGSDGFIISGINDYDLSGNSVSRAGDINGDGIDDLIIGAPGAEPGENTYLSGSYGESYIVFGGSDVGNSGNLELSTLNGSNGFVIGGIDEFDLSGESVSSAGDVNGDGIDDIIIGARLADVTINYSSEGESYVVFGGSNVGNSGNLELSTLNGNNGFVISGIDEGDNSGNSVSSAGDVNDDGIDDIIIGALRADVNDDNDAGESYVVFGGSSVGNSGNLELSALDSSNGFIISGLNEDDFSGSSVSSAGDVNNDGIDDIIIGAPSADPNGIENAGESYVIFGSSDGFAATLDLANLDHSSGFIISGLNEDDFSGSSVSSAGDVNNDGIDDIIIGAPSADPDGIDSAGESYVIFGFDSSEPDEIIGTDDDDVLIGTTENDTISGLLGADDILGAAGDDLIDGGAENDTLKGGRGADTILGGIGRDLIRGGRGNDFLRGNFADDTISGNLGADVLWGEFGNDELRGGKGNDILIGGRGNDNLRGNSGSDRLIGVDTINVNSTFGIGEIDTLTGGEGDDTYILADENRVFYDDGDDTTSGESDLAIITTLNTNRDTIQLQGSADLYSLDFFTSDGVTTDARLIYDPGTSAIGEAIAILEDVDPNLSVADSVFTFV